MLLLGLSGGLDSACLAAYALHEERVTAYTFDYGQRHIREVEAARAVAQHLGVPLHTYGLHGLVTTESSLLGGAAMPHGHPHDPSMDANLVQGRNLLFVSVMVAHAVPGDEVWLGACGNDQGRYADAHSAFYINLSRATREAYGVMVRAPFVSDTKAEVLRLGLIYGAPVELTWSCYEGGEQHCGRCGTCTARADAFREVGHPDPTEYAR